MHLCQGSTRYDARWCLVSQLMGGCRDTPVCMRGAPVTGIHDDDDDDTSAGSSVFLGSGLMLSHRFLFV
jgi:hypothetical protein